MTRVVHFDIPVDDPDRAGTFYREALGWKVEQYGPVEYWLLTTGSEPGAGAEGAMAPRAQAPEGVIVYFDVDDIDAAIARVEGAGGGVATEKVSIPESGWSAHVRDSEGNLIGLFQADPEAPMPEGGPGG